MTSSSELFDKVYVESHMAAVRKHVRAYQDIGIACIPVEIGTKNKFLFDWKKYQTAPPTGGEITEWFFCSQTPYNVAGILGYASGGKDGDFLVDLDVDGEAGQMRMSKALSDLGYCNNLRGTLMNTMMVRSGSKRGFHFLFWVGKDLPNGDDKDSQFLRELLRPAKQDLWKGNGEHEAISLLSQGSVAILPPSVHPDGKCNWYVWNNKAPQTIQSRKGLLDLFAIFSEDSPKKFWRNKRLRWTKRIKALTRSGNNNNNSKTTEANKVLTPEQMESLLKRTIPEYRRGSRNETVFRLSGELYKRGYSLDSALEFFTELCRITNDEEIESRLETVRRTYDKNASDVAGLGGTLDDF
jgi:Bifunctional DNA primase/polymerase, N-terminal